MIEDLVVSQQYWAVLIVSMLTLVFTLECRLFDFKFFTALAIAQRIAHLSMLPDRYFSSLIFSILTGLAVILGRRLIPREKEKLKYGMGDHLADADISPEVRYYFLLAGLFLAVYYVLRFASYPQFFSALNVEDRLQAEYDHKGLFIAALMSTAAIAAIVCRWLLRGSLTKWDVVLAVLMFFGALFSGSKASVIPIFLVVAGVAAYFGKKLKLRWIIPIILAISAGGGGALLFLFPGASTSDLFELIFHRIVASSEELEFLYVLNFQPGDYPFSGIGALFAPIAKRFGQNIEYPAGVWLYGERYQNWTGYGPNSGFVIEFFGNLGFFGLIIPLAVGMTIGYCEKKLTVYRAVLLSLFPLAFIETTFFSAALVLQLFLIAAAKIVSRLTARTRYPKNRTPMMSRTVL